MKKLLIILAAFILSAQPTLASITSDVEQGMVLFHSQQYSASQILLEKALGTAETDATIHYYLCRIHFALDSYERAIEHCKIAVRLRGNEAEYHFWLGRSYGAKAAAADAIRQALLAPKIRQAFERTIALDPTHVQGRVGLVNFYLRAPAIMGGSVEKAYEHVHIVIGFDNIAGRLLLARFYEKTKQLAAAEAAYQALQQQYGAAGEQHDIAKHYGSFLLRQQRYDKAIDVFTAHVRLWPTQAAAYEHLGDAYSASRRWQEAVEVYEKALQLDPAAITTTQKLHAAEKEVLKLLGHR